MFRKLLVPMIVLILVGAGGYGYYTYRGAQSAQAATASLATAPLERGDLAEIVSAAGNVHPSQSADLAWQTTGTVEALEIKEGDPVSAAQVLARLKQTSLPQNIILAQSDLIESQTALADLDTAAAASKISALEQISSLESGLRDAQYQLDNYTIPSDQVHLSTNEAVELMKQRLDEARTAFEPYKYYPSTDDTREARLEDFNEAQASYNSAIKRLQYESELEVAQSNLDQAWEDFNKWANGPDPDEVKMAETRVAAAQAVLSQAWIEAPFDGTITAVDVQVGDRVSAGKLAFRLDNRENLYVDVNISEVDIHKIQAGQEASLSFDALPEATYHGQVTEIANVSTTSGSSVNFTVTVRITDPDTRIRSGMTAEVQIAVGAQSDVLLIPIQAVHTADGKQMVYVVRPGQPEPQAVTVTLGISSDEYTALAEGDLVEGDPIVLNPAAITGGVQVNTTFGGPGGMDGPPVPGGGARLGGGGN